MSDYVLNEKDIAKVLNYLRIHDPKNADRDYAIQKLEGMMSTASEIVRSSGLSDEEIQQGLKDQGKTD
ncbi:MAG TPA: hypothetical protein VNE40_01120 [Candidatus Dormibacteraeota bacterium]|nr:hypothetical protein [Candidatus Dormibacteraeota bacterium]